MTSHSAVDFVAEHTSIDGWAVVLVEEGPWLDVDDNLKRLQDRLYAVVEAALDGRLAAQFPQTQGNVVVIQVEGFGLPKDDVVSFFDRFSSGVLTIENYAKAFKNNADVRDILFELNLHDVV